MLSLFTDFENFSRSNPILATEVQDLEHEC